MNKLENLEGRITRIEQRNKRVEADKAWETSNTRRFTLIVTTYAFMVLLMFVIGVANPFTSAIVPTTGYLLSTLSLPFVKKFWIKFAR